MSPKRRHEDSDGSDEPHSKASHGDPDNRKATFKAFITALNTQFSNYIQEQKGSNVAGLWIDGVKDYIEHAEQLLVDFKDVLDAAKQGPAGPKTVSFAFGATNGASKQAEPAPALTNSKPSETSTGTAPFSFGAAATASAAAPSSTPSSSFAFGGTASTSAPATAPAPFAFGGKPAGDGAAAASAPSSGTMFSFGGTAAPATTSGGFFNFGGSSSAAGGTSAAPFSFGGSAGGGAAGGDAEDEGDEEAPQKFESEVLTNDESGTVHFKVKAKMMHYKKGDGGKNAWDTKGVGLLQLRSRTEDPAKPFITFTTEAGRVLYIASIPKAMSLIVNEAKNMVSWSAPWSPDSSAPPSLQMVGMVLPKGKHPDFKAEVERLQGAMP